MRLHLLALTCICLASSRLAAEPGKVQYARDIQPILATYCFECHGPDDTLRKAKLRLDTFEGATAKLRGDRHGIVPRDPKASQVIDRVFRTGTYGRMPPATFQKKPSESEKALLKRWIEEGAEYQKHWAFAAPERPAVPTTKQAGWAKGPVDAFLLANLERKGLKPAAEADRYTLARRIAIDLTGLPPSLKMVDDFVADKRTDALETYVDRVMAQPTFGERWAGVWLDLARYADSNGYATDNPRTIWRYRDWVIDAINDNLPYDRFTIEQIAGDMLPGATREQMIATGFHRNTLTNDEGGTNDEEFRTAAVVDRVNTTLQVWMGVTMGCAQCHNHKYDPISQEDYFKVYAIFNQSEDADKGDNSPILTVVSEEQRKLRSKIEGEIAAVEKSILRTRPELDAGFHLWLAEVNPDKHQPKIKNLLLIDASKRTAAQTQELVKFYRETVAVELKSERATLTKLQADLKAVPVVTTPIMRDLPPGKGRVTKIQNRGNFLDVGAVVQPGVPALFHSLPKDAPANRLALACWLVDPANPLTARVAVNRFWEQLFGVGLVETPEDFGMRSKLPTHPELLDWLAVEFREGGWDVKKFLKLLVTTAAYRQSSKVTPELLEKDPDNRLFARGPRFRSNAEVIRDQALYVAGLLSPKMYGPPVRPPQPKIGLTAAFGPGTDWQTSSGEDKYRRALYTQWRRTTPYPSMITFDAPSRTVCSVSRARTNTPLQALVTLNDPVYIEAAQGLARRMAAAGGKTAEERVLHGFRLCLSRPPRAEEMAKLLHLYEQARDEFAKKPAEAKAIATEPLGPAPMGIEVVDLAALTVTANVLLNLDEMFAKR